MPQIVGTFVEIHRDTNPLTKEKNKSTRLVRVQEEGVQLHNFVVPKKVAEMWKTLVGHKVTVTFTKEDFSMKKWAEGEVSSDYKAESVAVPMETKVEVKENKIPEEDKTLKAFKEGKFSAAGSNVPLLKPSTDYGKFKYAQLHEQCFEDILQRLQKKQETADEKVKEDMNGAIEVAKEMLTFWRGQKVHYFDLMNPESQLCKKGSIKHREDVQLD